MTSPVQSTLPTGGTDSPSNGQTQPQPQANPTANWLPIMRLGQGQPGVFTDARGMIAGEPATVTAKDIASAASGIAAAMTGAVAGGAAGASLGSSLAAGGGNSTMPTGGTDSGGPDAQGGNVGANPSPAATSQAQREANLNNAYSQYGMQNPDPSVP
jgi:hypothetical protein